MRYDHRSKVDNQDIKFEFFLSYNTEISQINVNKAGSIILSNNFKTNIKLQQGCYDIKLHGNYHIEKIIPKFDHVKCFDDLVQKLDIYNFNCSLHGIVLQNDFDE